MPRSGMRAVGETLVAYSAEEMPNDALERIQHETVRDLNQGEITTVEAMRILNLLLSIALQKLQAVA